MSRWFGIVSGVDLPSSLRKDYIKFIEDETECPATIVSTGPRREETIVRSLSPRA